MYPNKATDKLAHLVWHKLGSLKALIPSMQEGNPKGLDYSRVPQTKGVEAPWPN